MFGLYGAYGVATLYTVGVAALCVRRGDSGAWLWIVLLFGPIGATVYLAAHFGSIVRPRVSAIPRPSAAELRRVRAAAEQVDTAAAWAECASVFGDRGRWEAAVEAARHALAKDPEHFDALYDLGRALLALKRPGEAREPLQKVVARKPDHASGEALFALAKALRGAGDLVGARAQLEALAERTSRADFLFELGTVQEFSGDGLAAKKTYQRIVDEFVFTPKYVRGRVRLWVWRARWRLRRLDKR